MSSNEQANIAWGLVYNKEMEGQIMFTWFPSMAELLSAWPVILSLIMIEGLLSVDNAMAIAAMASALPKNQQNLALRLGIIGAYLFRGICLALAAWIASNPWLKGVGSLYLLYLAANHLLEDEEEGGAVKKLSVGLLMTIVQIEVMDLSLSMDNVVAAVALDKRLWVICTGVFIGILALRFVAGACIKLIERFPVLKSTAFLLVGFVGVLLATELGFEFAGVDYHISSGHKFIGIVVITLISVLYGESALLRKLLTPVVTLGTLVLHGIKHLTGVIFLPATLIGRGVKHGHRHLLGRKKVAIPLGELDAE